MCLKYQLGESKFPTFFSVVVSHLLLSYIQLSKLPKTLLMNLTHMYIIISLLSSYTSITTRNKVQRTLGERVRKYDAGQATVEGKGWRH